MIIVGDLQIKYIEPHIKHRITFLKWLLDNFKNEVLILCGDIFQTSAPPWDVFYMFEHFLLSWNNQVHILMGNHDHSGIKGNSLSSFDLLSDIYVYENVTEVEIENNKCLILPFQYGNMKEKYEQLSGKYDYVFTHTTPIECSFDGEGIDFKNINGTFFHGHEHINKDFVDKYNNCHYVVGVPVPNRFGEHDKKHRIFNVKDTIEEVEVPIYFTYEDIEYGEFPENKDNIYNVKNAPDKHSVLETYKEYYIREEGITYKGLNEEINDITFAFKEDTIQQSFTMFHEEESESLTDSLYKKGLQYFSEVL